MNLKEAVPRFSLAFTLAGMALTIGQQSGMTTFVLTLIMLLDGLVILIDAKISWHVWTTIVKNLKELDIRYLAFGIGTLNFSRIILQNNVPAGLLFLTAAVSFLGLAIGHMWGSSGYNLIRESAKAALAVGLGLVLVGLVWGGILWKSSLAPTFIGTLSNLIVPVVIACYGLILVCFGYKSLKNQP